MALPKLNDSPKYELVIPSSNQKIRYRPYLVKEEKILMLAMESQDMNSVLGAVVDTIVACVEEPIERSKLAMFDVEYMFTQIRSKSVGETSKVNVKCKSCETSNEVSIDVSEIAIDVPKIDNMIELTSDIILEMKWPTYEEIISLGITDQTSMAENAFAMIGKCVSAIHTGEERIDTRDVPKQELEEFVDSMTSEQFRKVSAFIEKMPKLEHDVHFDCSNCGEKNDIKLQGMTDFF
jgi:hypothetical protein